MTMNAFNTYGRFSSVASNYHKLCAEIEDRKMSENYGDDYRDLCRKSDKARKLIKEVLNDEMYAYAVDCGQPTREIFDSSTYLNILDSLLVSARLGYGIINVNPDGDVEQAKKIALFLISEGITEFTISAEWRGSGKVLEGCYEAGMILEGFDNVQYDWNDEPTRVFKLTRKDR